MKIQTKELNAGGVKSVHIVDFGTKKNVRFEVWEYENGQYSFPTSYKFTETARQAVLDAIKSVNLIAGVV